MTSAIILAGGLGTRLRETVPNVPKPMAQINNRPFLEYQMDYWIDQGVSEFIISVGYLYNIIIEHFGESYSGIPVKYSVEKNPLGTGGALLLAIRSIKEPVLVLNGDTFFESNLEILKSFHFARHSDWTLSLFRSEDTTRYMGIEVSPDGRICSLKSGSAQDVALVNGGAYLINPSALSVFNKGKEVRMSLEDELLPKVLQTGGKVYGMEFSGRFIDIGVPADYFRAAEILD